MYDSDEEKYEPSAFEWMLTGDEEPISQEELEREELRLQLQKEKAIADYERDKKFKQFTDELEVKKIKSEELLLEWVRDTNQLLNEMEKSKKSIRFNQLYQVAMLDEDFSRCNSTQSYTTKEEQEITEQQEINRINKSLPVQAFHLTSISNLYSIMENGFHCGTKGKQGAGIYFCPRPLDCITKVVKKYGGNKSLLGDIEANTALIDVDLYLGKPFIINSYSEAQPPSEFDSTIYIDAQTGVEYVVYRPVQIVIRQIYLLNWMKLQSKTIGSLPNGLKQTRRESFESINLYTNEKLKPVVDRMARYLSTYDPVQRYGVPHSLLGLKKKSKRGKKSNRKNHSTSRR
jgi:hypothetical protein